jgi:putative flippase GtrA
VKRIFWFLVAGASGFAADAGMLALLLYVTPLGPFGARILAIVFALGVTWSINRAITFGRSRFPLVVEGARYSSVGIASAVLNYGIYAGILLLVPALSPLVAIAIASLLAMAFSWTGYSRFVFQK